MVARGVHLRGLSLSLLAALLVVVSGVTALRLRDVEVPAAHEYGAFADIEPAAPPHPRATLSVRDAELAARKQQQKQQQQQQQHSEQPTSLVQTQAQTKVGAAAGAQQTTAAGAKAATSTGTMAALSAYTAFRERNTRFSAQLESMFKEFDRDRDFVIDVDRELPLLVNEEIITQSQANMVSSWDLNGDGKISEAEFMNGPLYVSMLEFNPPAEAAFEKALDTEDGERPDLSRFTQMFARMAAGSSDDLPRIAKMRFSEFKLGDKTEEDRAVEEEYEAEQEEEEENAADGDDTARFASKRGRRRRRRKSKAKLTAAMILALKRPRSKWGVPSSRDENCVLCQYLVQRIQKQLYYTLANTNDGFPANPNAEIPAKKMRQVNAQLLNRRGGKGLLRILAEDIVSDMCNADQMPELFYPACKKIDKRMPVLLDAIYFQFQSEAVCEEARFCTSRTYFNRPSSVHLPSKSKIFNAARGRCGLMGGAHERPTKCFSSALCFAKHLFKLF